MSESFGDKLRGLRLAAELSQSKLAKMISFHQSLVSKVEMGRELPSRSFAEACDAALNGDGALLALAPPEITSVPPLAGDPWQVTELVRRLRLSDVDGSTLETLQHAAERLCTEYACRDPLALRSEAQQWIRYVHKLLGKRVGLREHRDLLVIAGWLALLIGCLEYDSGMSVAAESTRTAAYFIGLEADHAPIVAWSHEMSAWFALTSGELRDAVASARAGQETASHSSVAAQLAAHEARALARMGEARGVHAAFDRGHKILQDRAPLANPRNHFAVSADRFEYFVMDGLRVLGDDDQAATLAQDVVRKATGPNGRPRSPMRLAQARVALGILASRSGELEEAVDHGRSAFVADRKCLPSLLLVAGELDREMHSQWGSEESYVREFHEEYVGLRRSLPPPG